MGVRSKYQQRILKALIGIIAFGTIASLLVRAVYRERQRIELGQQMIAAVQNDDFALATTLLIQGADQDAPVVLPKARSIWLRISDLFRPQRPERSQFTVILLAASSDSNDAASFVTKLLDRGADTRARDTLGRPPLMLAVLFGRPSTVYTLLNHRADVHDRATNGWTALDALRWRAAFVCQSDAVEKGPVVAMLKQRGAR